MTIVELSWFWRNSKHRLANIQRSPVFQTGIRWNFCDLLYLRTFRSLPQGFGNFLWTLLSRVSDLRFNIEVSRAAAAPSLQCLPFYELLVSDAASLPVYDLRSANQQDPPPIRPPTKPSSPRPSSCPSSSSSSSWAFPLKSRFWWGRYQWLQGAQRDFVLRVNNYRTLTRNSLCQLTMCPKPLRPSLIFCCFLEGFVDILHGTKFNTPFYGKHL